MKTHSSLLVAQYLLDKANEANNPLTPMQLIKLVYLCHGWMIGLHGRSLISEDVEAWQYGPVISELYGKIKKYRSNPVLESLCTIPEGEFDATECSVMDQVFTLYGSLSGPALSRLTHASNTPWSITWEYAGKSAVISNDLIQDHFDKLYRKYSEPAQAVG